MGLEVQVDSLEEMCSLMCDNEVPKRVCPVCGKTYTGVPALSRVDNKTEICSYCGAEEALNAWIKEVNRKNDNSPSSKEFRTQG